MLTIEDVYIPNNRLALMCSLTLFSELFCHPYLLHLEATDLFLFCEIKSLFYLSVEWLIDPAAVDAVSLHARREDLNNYRPVHPYPGGVYKDALFYSLGPFYYIQQGKVLASSNQYYIDITAETCYRISNISPQVQIHNMLLQSLSMILDYKIKREEPFGNAELIFNHLNDNDKEKFLFNLDIFKKNELVKTY